MTALTVYASEGGARYHSRWSCPAFTAGSLLNDDDCDEWCRHEHAQRHPALDFTVAEAAECGRTPCRVCVPPLAASEDFGHEPMDVITNGKLRAVECYRCPVPWPCATAVLLGLAAAN